MWKFGRLINITKQSDILNFNIQHNALILQINNKTRAIFIGKFMKTQII